MDSAISCLIDDLKSKIKNHIFLLGGDFNLPDINWKMNDVTGNQVPETISKAFLHMSADLSIQQVNDHRWCSRRI
jgi:hypothetical protein